MAKAKVPKLRSNGVDQYLQDLEYPASKDEIIDEASSNGAPDDVMWALQNIPERPYRSADEVARGAYGT